MALELAKSHNLVIINADSAQVYADLPILSAQPSAAELASAPHKLFGYLDGSATCSAAKWAADAKRAIAEAHSDGALPVLVGGTGLYLRTLLDGIAPIPSIDPQTRAQIRAKPLADNYARLSARDPEVASRIGPTDSSRIARALEVIESTGQSISAWREAKAGGIAGDVDLHPLVLLPPREWLYTRCDARFDSMFDNGAVDEVRNLLARGLPTDLPVMRAIGVPAIRAALSGDLSADEALRLGKIATRQYAKRQYTWFRNQRPDDWPVLDRPVSDQDMANIETLLQL